MTPGEVPLDVLIPREGRTITRRLRVIRGTDPAVAAEILEIVQLGVLWRLMAIRFALVCDANVATRIPQLRIGDGRDVVWSGHATHSPAAGETMTFCWSTSADMQGVASFHGTGRLPLDLYLARGFRIETVTSNIQVGDNFGAPVLYVEEWLEV